MLLSENSGIDMSETEIEPGLTVKRKVTPIDVTVEREIRDLADTPEGTEFKSTKIQPTDTGYRK